MHSTFWKTFTAAPHRLFFFGGAIQLILPALLWSVELMGRYTSLWSPLDMFIPATWVHGMIMIYGLFIFFIFGFLMTVFPRWMGGEPIKEEDYVATAIWLNVGLILFECSLFLKPSLALSGLTIFITGWLFGLVVLYKSWRQAPAAQKHYETLLLLALLIGNIGVISFAWWLYSDDWRFIELSFNLGIWLYLLPVMFSVSHRMLPFFSNAIIKPYQLYQPRLSLFLFITGCVAHFSMLQLHLSQWLFLVDAPMAGLVLYHSLRWQLFKSFQDRLLGVLHLAFFWLFIGLCLLSIQSLVLNLSGDFILHKAPLHALSIGFAACLLIAMVSRVTLGHSGRSLHLDSTSWYLFIGLQLAAFARILSDIQFNEVTENYGFNLLAAALWLGCMSVWFVKYAPIYLSRRIDGKAG